jgi:signal peptidase I
MATYFAVFLVFLSVSSGLIWLIDAKFFDSKRRVPGAETAQAIFPMVLAITLFRSFVFEPFQIPSGSMKPNLLVGDFILVQKFTYGIKDPVTRTKLVEIGSPQRGDVAVFKYPEDPMIDYIKRIVGLPGDRIVYRDKTLFIKPHCESEPNICDKYQKVSKSLISKGDFMFGYQPLERLKEDLLGLEHDLLINPTRTPNQNQYFEQSGTPMNEWVVPEGHYFAMGDNRDNSTDSRYWGFVPEENFVGKAVFIWMSFEFHREPDDWIPQFIPTKVRFERLGELKDGMS